VGNQGVGVGRERFSVIEPLQLISVRRFGARLRLCVRDRTRARHVISFRFSSDTEARGYGSSLAGWIRDATPLAYVRGRGESALIEIDALLARAAF
jgi:hypothetical protein